MSNPVSNLCDDDISEIENIHDIEDACEIEYQNPVWNNIKPGIFLLVQFIGGTRKKTKFNYVCCVCKVNNDEGFIQVQGMTQEKKNQFSMKENDLLHVTIDMVLAILPEPILIQNNRKLLYEFPGSIVVNEK